jgi:hypothetical protein
MAKKNKNKASGRVITRAPGGAIISVKGGGGNKGGAAAGLGKVATLGAVLTGDIKAGQLTKEQRNKLANINLDKLEYNKKDLKKLGLTMADITAEDFAAIKGEFGTAFADNKVKKPELKGLKQFVGDTVDNRALAVLGEESSLEALSGIDTAAIQAEQRGRIAQLNMSLFARQAVQRARGVRATIGTSMRGAGGFGRNLARINLGAL